MADIRQHVAALATLPGTTWRADTALDTPKLLWPADEVRYCPELIAWAGGSADITLTWGAVSGASFYVIQTCETQSFSGPTVRGIRTASTSTTLTYLNQVSQGRKLFWRVAAYNAVGGASLISTPRSLELTCPNLLGTGYNPDDTPGTNRQYCDKYGVNLEIFGPDQVRLTDEGRAWSLNVNYDCKDEAGTAVAVNTVSWTITQSDADVTKDATLSTDYKLVVDVAATENQAFDIRANVQFSIGGTPTFNCDVTKKILIEGVSVGSGGATSMWFTVDSVACDAAGRYLIVTPHRVAPPCVAVPGADEYGLYYVRDDGFLCILNEYTDAELLELKGKATYASDVDQGYGCVEGWTLDGLCDTGNC